MIFILINQQGSKRNLTVEDIAVIMFYSNLVLDPLVYGLGSSDFRGKFGTYLRPYQFFNWQFLSQGKNLKISSSTNH